jgi:hypothetical protein
MQILPAILRPSQKPWLCCSSTSGELHPQNPGFGLVNVDGTAVFGPCRPMYSNRLFVKLALSYS